MNASDAVHISTDRIAILCGCPEFCERFRLVPERFIVHTRVQVSVELRFRCRIPLLR